MNNGNNYPDLYSIFSHRLHKEAEEPERLDEGASTKTSQVKHWHADVGQDRANLVAAVQTSPLYEGRIHQQKNRRRNSRH